MATMDRYPNKLVCKPCRTEGTVYLVELDQAFTLDFKTRIERVDGNFEVTLGPAPAYPIIAKCKLCGGPAREPSAPADDFEDYTYDWKHSE